MSRRGLWVLLGSLTLAAASCGAESVTSTTSADGPLTTSAPATQTIPGGEIDPEVATLLQEWAPDDSGEPVDLDYVTDGESSVSALIGTAGGSISTSSADGTEYTLDFPAGALIADETITMTPLSSVSGVPTDATVAGVLLEPEGLVLASPATLTIAAPAGSSDLRAGTTFADGEDFHVVPSDVVDDALVVEVHHFSVQTNMKRAEQLADLRDRYEPTSGQARWEESFAAAMELRGELSEGDRDLTEGLFIRAIIRMFDEWMTSSVLPHLEAATLDEGQMDAALGEAGTFLGRIGRLYDFTEDGSEEEAAIEAMSDRVKQAVGLAIEAAIDRAAERCVANNDPDEAARIWRWSQIALRANVAWAIEGTLASRVVTCLTFELDMTAAFSADAITSVATATLFFDYLSGEESVTGVPRLFAVQAPMAYDVFEVDGIGSGCETSPSNGLFEFELALEMNVNYLDPGIQGLSLTVRVIQSPRESIVCGAQTIDFSVEGGGGFWLPHFRSATNTIGGSSEFVIVLPVVRDGDVFARLTSSGAHPVIPGSTEDISYELIHRPGT